MADEFIPELTLNPNSPLAGQGQAAAVSAPAAASTPPAEAHLPESDLDEAKLSPAQRKAVEDFARTIDITDSNVVLQYGAAAQKNVSEFSENTLQQIRTKDLGLAVGDFSLMRENRLRLDYLPADCQLLGGDLVVTSGLGGYYPSGLSVGTVEEVQLSDSGAASYAVLEPAADFDSLVEVFVIKSFDIQT